MVAGAWSSDKISDGRGGWRRRWSDVEAGGGGGRQGSWADLSAALLPLLLGRAPSQLHLTASSARHRRHGRGTGAAGTPVRKGMVPRKSMGLRCSIFELGSASLK
jgi:hypothetical protein